jgi:DNA polymerase III alpha subunit
MSDTPFVHLHCHRLLAAHGACGSTVDALAEEQGIPAVAITDHGNFRGGAVLQRGEAHGSSR